MAARKNDDKINSQNPASEKDAESKDVYKDDKNDQASEEVSYKDLYLRVTADFQNYRRIVEKERLQWCIEAQIEILKPLLSIIDDIDRSIDSLQKQDDKPSDAFSENMFKGLELIQKNVYKTFKDLEVVEIDCSGQFDPDFHEALLEIDSSDHPSGEIVEVISKGYMFKSQVIKHAKVSVAR